MIDSAIKRIMDTYNLLATRTPEISEQAREQVTDYVSTLFAAGEKDLHRLTVCGLTFLRQRDGSTDTVKAGFTGL